jgi:hypothetical protein
VKQKHEEEGLNSEAKAKKVTARPSRDSPTRAVHSSGCNSITRPCPLREVVGDQSRSHAGGDFDYAIGREFELQRMGGLGGIYREEIQSD